MKPLDLTKPLQTRLGQKAELVYDGLTGDWPLAVVVHTNYGIEVRSYARNGVHYQDEDSPVNLMNVPEKRTIWLNIYEDRQTGHPNRDHADYFAGYGRLACIEVTYTEGEGL